MTPEQRLNDIVSALESVGVSCLVMGGHAVRFYGLARNTNDFDLHVAPDPWDDVAERLSRTPLFSGQPVVEGPSWRARAFKRFRIGTLPDGKDEWLECWRENHLLAPHAELLARAERGLYGQRQLAFLSLMDLIRSKETERDADWQDVSVLEGFLDSRLRAGVRRGNVDPADALGQLRSRAGFGDYFRDGALADHQAVVTALASTNQPITQAYLIPFAPEIQLSASSLLPIEPVVLDRLRTLAGGSPLHLALVEVVRRRYILFRKALDRQDKDAVRAAMQQSAPATTTRGA
jgi:hypothetical protein